MRLVSMAAWYVFSLVVVEGGRPEACAGNSHLRGANGKVMILVKDAGQLNSWQVDESDKDAENPSFEVVSYVSLSFMNEPLIILDPRTLIFTYFCPEHLPTTGGRKGVRSTLGIVLQSTRGLFMLRWTNAAGWIFPTLSALSQITFDRDALLNCSL